MRDSDVELVARRHRLDVFLSSRDAAHALTNDALDSGVACESLTAAATDVASYADEAIAIVRDEYRPALACREGCAFCCCKPGVLVTVPEFLRIVAHVRTTFPKDALIQLAEKAGRYVAQLDGRAFNEPTHASVPCPLLVDDRCSVYGIRPLVCRGYNSTDVDACRRAHADPSVLVPIFAIVKDVADGAAVGTCHALAEAGVRGRAVVDLGTALHVALSAGEDFLMSIAAGHADGLARAEDASWAPELWRRVRDTAERLGIVTPDLSGA